MAIWPFQPKFLRRKMQDISYANMIYVVCQDTVQDNEAEQEMPDDNYAKKVGNMGIQIRSQQPSLPSSPLTIAR